MGYGVGFKPLVRIMMASAVAPQLTELDPELSKRFGFSGRLTDGPYDIESYKPMHTTEAVIFEGMMPLRESLAKCHTIEQFVADYVERTVVRALWGRQVQLIILCFDTKRHDLKDCTSINRERSQRKSSTPLELDYFAGGERKDRLMGCLVDHLLLRAPLRPGLTIIVSGLTHLASGIDRARACQMPLCVRLSEDGPFRIGVHPSKVLSLWPDSGLKLPTDPREWFTTTFEADDQIKFFLVVMLNYKPPPSANNQSASSASSDAPMPREKSPNFVIVSEDFGIMMESLVVMSTYANILRERDRRESQRMGKAYFLGKVVCGYRPAPGATSITDKKNGIEIGQQIDLQLGMRILCHCFDRHFGGLGITTPMALMLLCFMRVFDYRTTAFMNNTNEYALARALAQASQSDMIRACPSQPFLIDHVSTEPGQLVNMFHPPRVMIEYQAFARVLLLVWEHIKGKGELKDAAMRSFTAQLSLFFGKMMGNWIPGWQCPSATLTHKTMSGEEISTFGFSMQPRSIMGGDSNGFGVASTICAPLLEMPTDATGRCSDSRVIYELPMLEQMLNKPR